MRRCYLERAVVLLCLAFIAGFIYSAGGCATQPKGPTQTLYSAGWTLVGATNAVADLHDSGQLTGANYATAKGLLEQATTAYQTAKAATQQGKPADAATYLTLLQTLLLQLSTYLSEHGGK
jgi:hypothetical protein